MSLTTTECGGRPFGFKIVTPAREWFITAHSDAERINWIAAVRRASTASGGAAAEVAAAPRLLASDTEGEEGTAVMGNFLRGRRADGGAASGGGGGGGGVSEERLLPPLPAGVTIAGLPEVGAELCVLPVNGTLKDLCIQWFAVPAELCLGSGGALTEVPAGAAIHGATAQYYALSDSEVGRRVGCYVKAALGGDTVLAMLGVVVRAVDTSVVTARLHLVPHEHSKYCDRKDRVCTAEGRFREGETLIVRLRGPNALFSTVRVRWYRSRTPGERPGDAPSCVIEGVEFDAFDARPASSLPPAPAAHEVSRPIQELLAAASAPDVEPMPRTGRVHFPLLADDVGRIIVCDLAPVDGVRVGNVI